ncbi:MAG TPA: GTP 3',8-cyclase MoaA [Polyangiales bacterium]|nr:GTP 3',8-cyclase MoaA [Polyangiales bacterium]
MQREDPQRTRDSGPVLDQFRRPLYDLRVSVTDRCNFRCDYCMPKAIYADERRFLPTQELLSFDEITRVVTVAARDLGVRKLRITGGEPLLRPNLASLITRLAETQLLSEITLTTNGLLLAAQAAQLKAAGLDRITISLDSVDADEFVLMSGGVAGLDRVLAGIAAASSAGFPSVKINCVVMRGHNENAILALAERFRGTPHVLRFIEYMDVGTQNTWRAHDVVSANEILSRIDQRWPVQPLPAQYPGEVARRYRYRDGAGEIGIIASVSEPFCGECQRARLSADGRLLTCLFAADGVALKPLLRTARHDAQDSALRELLCESWRARKDRYSQERKQLLHKPRRRLEMYQVGG